MGENPEIISKGYLSLSLSYIHSEKDILKLVTALIANTKGEGKAGDDFWVKAETLLYIALIGYIHYELLPERQNFATLIDMLDKMQVREDDEDFRNEIDDLFDDLAQRKPGALCRQAIPEIQDGVRQNGKIHSGELRRAPCRL